MKEMFILLTVIGIILEFIGIIVIVRELLKDRETANRMGKAGRDRVLKDFTVQVFAERTLEAYRRAMAFHHRASSH